MVSRVKGQKAEKVPGRDLKLVSGPVPGALSQRRQKGLRFEAPLPAPKTQRRACPSVLTFQRRSVPPLSLGTPGTLSQAARSTSHSHAYPTPQKPLLQNRIFQMPA